jgi:hypothetical protein
VANHKYGKGLLASVTSSIQADNQLSESEQYAVSHLCNWLEEVDEADDIDDINLDGSALSYLKSYRESYSRRKPYPVGCLLFQYIGNPACSR